jgi:hypothetical protein
MRDAARFLPSRAVVLAIVRRLGSFTAGLCLALLAATGGGRADDVSERFAIARLFTEPAMSQSWFTPSFLAAVPLEQMRVITSGMTAQLGAYRSIQQNIDSFTLHFANGSVQATVQMDGDAIAALRFYDTQSDAASARLAALFTEKEISADWFAPAFLAQAPAAQIQGAVSGVRTQLGRFQSADASSDGSYTVRFDRGTDRVQVTLDGDGKVSALSLDPPALSAPQ